MVGMHGTICSMDACYVTIEKCSHILKQNHIGGQSKQTVQLYNLSIHTIIDEKLHTTGVNPIRWNDKITRLYNNFARVLKNGTILHDNFFKLFEKRYNDFIIKVKYCGAW